METIKPKKIFEGTFEWWAQIYEKDFILTEGDWNDHVEDASEIDSVDPESWIAEIVEIKNPEHTALKVGDWVASQGIGSPVTFWRF